MLDDSWRWKLLGQSYKYETRNAAKALNKAARENLPWEYIEEQIAKKKFDLGGGIVYCEFSRLKRGERSERVEQSLDI
jgi:hypothetical protein